MLICINFAFERIHYEKFDQGGMQMFMGIDHPVGGHLLSYPET
jgi:hypothetical protein